MSKKAAVEFKIIRGTRRERLLASWLYNRIVRGIVSKYGEYDEEKQGEYPIEGVAMLADVEVVRKYCRIILYADRSNGVPNLKTADGKKFSIPDMDSPDEKLVESFWDWICTDERTTDAIDAEILTVNSKRRPRHLAPEETLTPEERADPNS